MKRYSLLIICLLALGFGIGHFHNEYQQKKATAVRGHIHVYKRWESSGKTGGLSGSRIVMQRQCYICGSLESKLSD